MRTGLFDLKEVSLDRFGGFNGVGMEFVEKGLGDRFYLGWLSFLSIEFRV